MGTSLSLCLLSLLFFSQNSPGDAAPAFENICNSIEGGQISNKFCYDTLKDFPDINSANEHGVGVIAVELTLRKANATVAAIFDLLNKAPKDDPKSIQPLQQCLQIYLALKTDLGTEITEFVKTERYEAARIQLVNNTKQPPLCQAGSISKENADFSQLINLAANIIQYLEEN